MGHILEAQLKLAHTGKGSCVIVHSELRLYHTLQGNYSNPFTRHLAHISGVFGVVNLYEIFHKVYPVDTYCTFLIGLQSALKWIIGILFFKLLNGRHIALLSMPRIVFVVHLVIVGVKLEPR